MEATHYFMGGYLRNTENFSPEKRMSEQKMTENFRVDDLLDFSNEDAVMSDGFPDNVAANSTDSSNFSANSLSHNHLSANFGQNCYLSGDLCVPHDDMEQLEWLSNFVEDSFSADKNLQSNLHILSGSKSPTETSSTSTQPDPASRGPINPVFHSENPLPGKARSKRSRAAPCDWTTRLLHLTPKTEPLSPKKKENQTEPTGRRCLHCATEKTPQWRTGPLGPKTLCNACGVRYKSGRLVPEYRPASSPTFVPAKHSNSHRKVIELRRQREIQRQQQQQPQFLSQNSIFCVSNGDDDFLIHHGGPNFYAHDF